MPQRIPSVVGDGIKSDRFINFYKVLIFNHFPFIKLLQGVLISVIIHAVCSVLFCVLAIGYPPNTIVSQPFSTEATIFFFVPYVIYRHQVILDFHSIVVFFLRSIRNSVPQRAHRYRVVVLTLLEFSEVLIACAVFILYSLVFFLLIFSLNPSLYKYSPQELVGNEVVHRGRGDLAFSVVIYSLPYFFCLTLFICYYLIFSQGLLIFIVSIVFPRAYQRGLSLLLYLAYIGLDGSVASIPPFLLARAVGGGVTIFITSDTFTVAPLQSGLQYSDFEVTQNLQASPKDPIFFINKFLFSTLDLSFLVEGVPFLCFFRGVIFQIPDAGSYFINEELLKAFCSFTRDQIDRVPKFTQFIKDMQFNPLRTKELAYNNSMLSSELWLLKNLEPYLSPSVVAALTRLKILVSTENILSVQVRRVIKILSENRGINSLDALPHQLLMNNPDLRLPVIGPIGDNFLFMCLREFKFFVTKCRELNSRIFPRMNNILKSFFSISIHFLICLFVRNNLLNILSFRQ